MTRDLDYILDEDQWERRVGYIDHTAEFCACCGYLLKLHQADRCPSELEVRSDWGDR